MLIFAPPSDFAPGTIERLLRESYEAIRPKLSQKEWKKLTDQFRDFEQEVALHPEIARCTFISVEDGIPIGVGSYDPRKSEMGIIGDNVILPSARGKGYGKLPLKEILRQLKAKGVYHVRVSTGDQPFFLSAQANYKSAGFKETRRFVDDIWKSGQIEYEMEL
ncbi:MAG: GNAT family N-acetyltransferase [Candidatus Peribacteraceae bacterium]|nr:GNAT family N-acetyltransferase [Candidatus Peribacteraceae bacterium]MDD5740181.1 GNAT family N-acetyltransferase [Candidatus Peribacteraceae bacterium]